MRHAAVISTLVALLVPRLAQAQTEPPAPRPAGEEGAYEEAPVTEQTPPSEPGAEGVDLDSLASLTRLGISGYVQPELRYEHSADDELLYFQVRRGRLKIQYDLDPALFLVQLDATQDGVRLMDAYAGLSLPVPEGMDMMLMAGLFNTPFGFDLQHSSSRRVFPERAQMVRRLFPGERDLGVRLDTSLAEERIQIQVAVMNGVPLGDEFRGEFQEADGDDYKDAVLRVAVSPLEHLTVGASGLYGAGTRLVEDDPATPEDETGEFGFPRWAAGAEVRFQPELEPLGGLDLYGEVSFSRNLARKSLAEYPTNEGDEVDVLSWYVAAVQQLGELFALGARFDQLAYQGGETHNLLSVLGMLVPAGGTRVVLAWDFDVEDSSNHEGWLRMQVKF